MSRVDRRQILFAAVAAVASLATATLVVWALEAIIGVPDASAIYLVAVVATAFLAGTLGAVMAAIGAFLLYNFLFIAPVGSLLIDDPGQWLELALLLFVAIVVGQMVALLRARAEDARAREHEALALFSLSRALATRDTTLGVLPQIIEIVLRQTHAKRAWVAIGGDDASERVAADTGSGPSPPLPSVVNVLGRAATDEPPVWIRVHQAGTRARSGVDEEAFRARMEVNGRPLGSIWAIRDRRLGVPDRTESRLLAVAADQLGQALAHDRLAAEIQAAEIARQADALKSALVQSVSHDLRTPLATIRAAAGTLQPDSGLTSEERRESADTIDREVAYLDRLVTNLLDLSRIEAGALRAELDAYELEDLVGRTLERMRRSIGERQMDVELEASPVLVDPVFLDEAVTNVIENALKYSPPGSPLRLTAVSIPDGWVRLTIEDGGHGVPEASLPRLFEKFYRVPGRAVTSRSGTGIGLAVVLGLIEASGGRVSARRSELGGLAIDLELPRASQSEGPEALTAVESSTSAATA